MILYVFVIALHIFHRMRWHHENASKDGIMRQLVDILAWKSIDSKWPEFSNDPRNV